MQSLSAGFIRAASLAPGLAGFWMACCASTLPSPQLPGASSATRLQGLRGGHLNSMYARLEQGGLSVATRRFVHAVIRRALGDAVRWGLLVRNPASQADPPKLPRSRAHAWTAAELRRFLEHVADDRLFALWRLATTGMRRGELAGVTWRALDLNGANLTVEQQLVPTRGGATLTPPKSERSRRTIALDPATVDALRAHRDTQVLERDFAGPRTSTAISCSLMRSADLSIPNG
jgi:integrase